MEISSELLQRFFDGLCTPEEEACVKAWIFSHPDYLSGVMTEKSWELFFNQTKVPAEKTKEMFSYITKHTRPKRKWSNWAVAASIVAILVSGMLYVEVSLQKAPLVLSYINPGDVQVVAGNPLNTEKRISLSDGSMVILFPGSSIRYDSSLLNKRDIFLKGEALFSVAKDSTRPFCVRTKDVRVTALGTQFRVSEKDPSVTSVSLFEGKVVVKKEGEDKGVFEDVVLNPGQEFTYNKRSLSVQVDKTKQLIESSDLMVKYDLKPEMIREILYFNNQHLSRVLSKLQEQYNVRIEFRPGLTDDIRYTGMHNPKEESLEDFLNRVAFLDNLKVELISGVYVVSPQ